MITHYNEMTDTTNPEDIDWNNIDFLTAKVVDKMLVIQRASVVGQYGGLMTIVAYLNNFKRVIISLGGQNLIDSLDDGVLWNIAMTLANGAEVPLPIE